jgi:pimeloyl-ACP methyl ester carboxylesterase
VRRLVKWFIALLVLLGIAFLLLRTPDTDVAAMRAKYGAEPSQFVDLGRGLTVHLRDEGPRDATVIVLLHGSNDDLHTWDAWSAALKGQYRIVRFDQIGHGLTGPNPTGDYSLAAFESTIELVMAKLGVQKFTLAGNSMGGAIAASYAMNHPDRLNALVLVDAGGAPKANPTPGNIGFKLAALPGVNQLMRWITPRSLIEKSLRQSVTNQAFITPAIVDRYWELLRYPGNRQATIARFAGKRETFDPARLAQLKMPVLVMWGEQDKLINADGARWYARSIPGSKLTLYPSIGHMPQQELAGQIAADVARFVGSPAL